VKNEKLLRKRPQLPQGTTANIHRQKNAEKTKENGKTICI
jgi:hypothetical protein